MWCQKLEESNVFFSLQSSETCYFWLSLSVCLYMSPSSLSILLAFEMLTTRCFLPPVLTWGSGDLPMVCTLSCLLVSQHTLSTRLYHLYQIVCSDALHLCCQGCDALVFLSSDTKIGAHVSALLNICSWKSAHHCNLNLDKTELFFFFTRKILLYTRPFHHK